MTTQQINQLKDIKALEGEIKQLKEQEKTVEQHLMIVESSMARLQDSLAQKVLELDPKESKKLEKSSVMTKSMYDKLNLKVPPPKEDLEISAMIRSKQLRPINEIETELTKMRINEATADSQLNSNLYVLDAFDNQYRKITRVHPNLGNIVADLKYSLEEAHEMGIVNQDLMQSNRNFGGKIEVVEVEDLFECDGVEVC